MIERLEPRQLLAVTTSFANGLLTITGDGDADNIAIVGTATPGQLVVTGRPGTFVNNMDGGNVTISGVTDRLLPSNPGGGPRAVSLLVDLGDGNDTVSLDNAYIAGSINIVTGNGDDSVVIGQNGVLSPTGDLNIDTGAGNDRVSELNYAVFIAGANSISLGDGHNVATLVGVSGIGRPTYPYVFSANGISVGGGRGNDSILGVGLTAVQGLSIGGGGGGNSLALLFSAARSISISTTYDPDTSASPGNNTYYLDTNYSQSAIWISTYFTFGVPVNNVRDSTLNIFRSQTTSLDIQLGYGNNSVNLFGNAMNGPEYPAGGEAAYNVQPHLSIQSYPYFDDSAASQISYVDTLSYNVSLNASVTLSNGNDSLFLAGNIFSGSSTLDGRLGRNTIGESYNFWGSLIVKSFG
jgi:hypothetical protein